MINRIGLTGTLISGALAVTINMTLASIASAQRCVAGSVHGVREFSVPRNGFCVLFRKEEPGQKFLGYRLSVRPKLGQFGQVNLFDFAYHAGNVAGDDYFEYISMQTYNGLRHDVRVRNTVHVLP